MALDSIRRGWSRATLGGILALALGSSLPLAGAELRVGTGTGCVYATIADAVAAAVANGTVSDLILVKTSPSQILAAPITLDLNVAGTVEIVGGYSACTDALPNPGSRSAISLPSSAGFTVQNAGGSSRTFTLQQLSFIAGAGGGRLLDVSGRVLVNIDDSLLSNGTATDGANIRMAGPNVVLFIANGSAIYSGDATGDGGGIHCSGGGTVLLDDSAIDGNFADGSGGGAYLDGCHMNVFAGGGPVSCPSGLNRGITCNYAGAGAALASGGGVYATNGAVVNFLGSATQRAALTQNTADYGGGLFITGAASQAEFVDADILENAGIRGGGGVAADNGAQLVMRSTITSCGSSSGCSRVMNNHTSSISGATVPGGGVWVTGGADADIRRTHFEANQSPTGAGAAVAVDGAGSTALLEGDLFYAQQSRPIFVYGGGNLTAAFVTAWFNFVGSSGTFGAIDAGSNIAVYSSATLDALTFAPLGTGATYSGDCIVTLSLANFPPPPDTGSFEVVASAAAVLASPATGNPRLRADSPAIDFCDTFRYTPVDFDIHGEARGFDVPAIPNSPFGAYDLGADEWRSLFASGFEPGDCSEWSAQVGGC